MAEFWSDQEIDHIVADYFAMLTDELVGRAFNKAARNRDLQAVIDRSKGSIEFKHQNISAVLLGLGQPWIEGYKPAANFQNALVDGVLRWLEARPEWLAPDRLSRAGLNVPEAQGSLRIGPPPTVRNEPSPIDPAFMAAIGRKYDVAERDARNRALGKNACCITSAAIYLPRAATISRTKSAGHLCRMAMVLASISGALKRTGARS